MKRYAMLLITLPVLLGAAAPSPQQAPPLEIHASHAWFRYLLSSVPAGGYMTLINSGDTTTRLVKASSPACGALMLHQTVNHGGAATMEMVKSVTIPAHGSVGFAEGGYHLMCMEPRMKPGDKVSVTLGFDDGATLMLLVPVYGPAGPPGTPSGGP